MVTGRESKGDVALLDFDGADRFGALADRGGPGRLVNQGAGGTVGERPGLAELVLELLRQPDQLGGLVVIGEGLVELGTGRRAGRRGQFIQGRRRCPDRRRG